MGHVQVENNETAIESESLGKKIELIIQGLPPNEVTLIEIVEIVGADSLMLLTIFLSLVFIVPISIPGVSTVFGAGIILIGITRLFNSKPWLPKAIGTRKLSSEKLREGLNRALVWFNKLEKISRPHRLPGITADGLVTVINNLSFIFAGLLLMAPFGFIPFSNTLPALALIFLSVGMMQQDGRFILYGYFSNAATVLYFAILVTAGSFSIRGMGNKRATSATLSSDITSKRSISCYVAPCCTREEG
jgi:hypothetical protein